MFSFLIQCILFYAFQNLIVRRGLQVSLEVPKAHGAQEGLQALHRELTLQSKAAVWSLLWGNPEQV